MTNDSGPSGTETFATCRAAAAAIDPEHLDLFSPGWGHPDLLGGRNDPDIVGGGGQLHGLTNLAGSGVDHLERLRAWSVATTNPT